MSGRRRFALAPALVLALACAGDAPSRPPIVETHGLPVVADSMPDRLNLFTWPDYMDPELLADFEQTYGTRVNVDYYDNNEAMLAKLKAGGLGQYDVAIASDYVVEVLSADGLLERLDGALLPNRDNLDARFRAMPFDPDERWAVAYQWGTTGLGIRTDRVDTAGRALDTWRLVFDHGAQPGPFAMLNDMRETIGAALLYLGHSANSTDAAQLAAAESLLVAQRPRVLTYAPFASGRDLLASGDVVVAHNFSGDVLLARDDVPGIGFVIPREGAVIWTDNLVIPRDAPSAYAAHVFINYLLDAQVGARLSNWTRYASPNAAALPFIDADLRADPAIYPDSTVLDQLEFLRDVGEARALYDRVWTRVRAGG